MAKILLLSADTTHITHIRARDVFLSHGYDVHGTDSIDPAELDVAFANAAPDIIATARPTMDREMRDWVKSKWDSGVPVLLGGVEAGASNNVSNSTHLGTHLGLSPSVLYRDTALSAGRAMVVLEDHPTLGGASGTVSVYPTSNWSAMLSTSAGHNEGEGVRIARWNYQYGVIGAYMAAWEAGDLTGTDTIAPARAVFLGWLFAAQSDYSAEAKAIIGSTVDWLVPTPQGTDVAGTPAGASAEMLDAEFSNIGHAKINAAPMHAEARSGYHEVFGDRAPYTRRLLSPVVKYWGSNNWTVTPARMGSAGNTPQTLSYAVEVPDGLIDPTDIQVQNILRLEATKSGRHGITISTATDDLNHFSVDQLLDISETYARFHEVSVPRGTKWLRVVIRVPSSYGDGVFYDNPSEDATSALSHFMVSAEPAPVTMVPAETAHASALAIQPALDITANILRYVPATNIAVEALNAGVSVQTAADISMQTTPANAEGFMPNPTMPNVGVYPDAALGTAAMNATWFSSEVRVNTAYAEANGEALDIEGVTAGRNIIAGVAAATARATIREPWLSINDVEVDRNHIDPYWQRVARRSTVGYLPPAANQWYRLNQREGNFVQRLDQSGVFVTNPPSGYVNGYTMQGDFEWGAAGPNGKRGIAVREAVFGSTQDTIYDQNTSGQHSVEFTVKIDPGHVGRMEIARGRARHVTGYSAPFRTFDLSIRDGKVYFSGHSVKRIDDGEWHHVVVTSTRETVQDYHNEGFKGKVQMNRAIYIDGELDRFLTSTDNTGGTQGFVEMAAPTRFLGGDTDYPFRGEILDIVAREAILSHEVRELYLDMFGYKAVRAGAVQATADAFQGHRVVSSMKRMLLITWMPVDSPRSRGAGIGWSAWNDKGYYQHSIVARDSQLGPMLGYGWDEELDVGRYLVTVQQADRAEGTAIKQEVLDQNTSWQLTDPVTGRRRLINLVEDIDLDQFDVVAFQSYPNVQYRDMHERQMYENFLDSVNEALVRGQKIWVTDPWLAADLGWVTDVDEVPVMGRLLNNGRMIGITPGGEGAGGNDVRGYEVAPWAGLSGNRIAMPVDGSMPHLPTGIPNGSQWGLHNLWSWDVHHNNGYRVVNEVEGLTDIPTWELEEAFMRNRTTMLPNNAEHEQRGYRLENRTGEDYEWDLNADGSWKHRKASKGLGLHAGDEFYDFKTYDRSFLMFKAWDSLTYDTGVRNRVISTWAIPPGHLRIGTPLTTFRSTIWNDFGHEVPNPYRNHVRNAVIRPGDRLPDGRKINGYAYVEFAEHPVFGEMAGMAVKKQLPDGIETQAVPNEPTTFGDRSPGENPYSFEWDYLTPGRISYSGGGNVKSVQVKFHYGPKVGGGGSVERGSKGEIIEWLLPLAQTHSEKHPVDFLPHQTWNSRGISWLTLVDSEDTEVALGYQDASMEATAEMLSPIVDVDFDNTVSVAPAQANGRIVDPGETVIKATTVVAYAATARGTMRGLQGGYKAEAATSFGDMPQNVRRPLDVQEVLFFTVAFTQEPIYVRMEEN